MKRIFLPELRSPSPSCDHGPDPRGPEHLVEEISTSICGSLAVTGLNNEVRGVVDKLVSSKIQTLQQGLGTYVLCRDMDDAAVAVGVVDGLSVRVLFSPLAAQVGAGLIRTQGFEIVDCSSAAVVVMRRFDDLNDVCDFLRAFGLRDNLPRPMAME